MRNMCCIYIDHLHITKAKEESSPTEDNLVIIQGKKTLVISVLLLFPYV